MAFAGVNYLAVAIAAVAGFLFGGIYYGVLSNAWLSALGKSKDEVQKTGMTVPLVVTAIALLLMAWVLAGIIGHLGAGQGTLKSGIISGFMCWLGFVATSIATNHAYQGAKTSLTLIDTGYWLGVLLIEGAIIGYWGVR
jgi:hypothetical protein